MVDDCTDCSCSGLVSDVEVVDISGSPPGCSCKTLVLGRILQHSNRMAFQNDSAPLWLELLKYLADIYYKEVLAFLDGGDIDCNQL